MKLTGKVSEGSIEWDSLPALEIALRHFAGKRVEVEIKNGDKRSLEANARYWSLLNPLAQECFKQKYGRTLTKYPTHYALVLMFCDCATNPITGDKIPKETKDMTTAEFYKFTHDVEAWLHEEWPESGAFEETA